MVILQNIKSYKIPIYHNGRYLLLRNQPLKGKADNLRLNKLAGMTNIQYNFSKPTPPAMPRQGKGTESVLLLPSQESKDMHQLCFPYPWRTRKRSGIYVFVTRTHPEGFPKPSFMVK